MELQRNRVWAYELDCSASGQEEVTWSENGDTSGSLKGGGFPDYLSDYYLLKINSIQWT
jgi:hypothetical protein